MAKRHSISQDSLFESWPYTFGGHTHMSRTPAERFWDFVPETPPDDCWNWRGNKSGKGYGAFKVRTPNGYAQALAHRISWLIHYGNFPSELFVCHRCDNPGCVNPLHLFLGTDLDNIIDMVMKNRGGTQKLSPHDVREIRKARGVANTELAKRFGVSPVLISRIRHGRAWHYLDEVA